MGKRSRAVGGAAYLVPLLWIALLLVLSDDLSPWLRIGGATVGLLYAIKIGSWLLLSSRDEKPSLSPIQALVYWTAWPSVRPGSFVDAESEPDPRDFVRGYVFGVVGVVLVAVTVLTTPYIGDNAGSWLMIFGLLLIFHFGVGTVMPFALRWAGVPAPSLFDRPLRSQGVGEFWSSRWNLPFVEMNRLFITRPLGSRFSIGVSALTAFLVSGFLHEMAISYAAGAGWGTPFVYFVVQGVAYYTEQRYFPEDDDSVGDFSLVRSLWTWAVVLLPLPLLFHAPFRGTFVVPIIDVLGTVVFTYPLVDYLSLTLWVGAAGHFLVLAASFQVPDELEWRDDLKSLKPLNRKLMWTYGGFIVLTIVSFGALTAVFHDEFVAGNPVALGVSAVIAVFWTARIVVDFLYFSHEDWPSGTKYVVGHAMLTSLFLLLVAIYAGTVVFHVIRV